MHVRMGKKAWIRHYDAQCIFDMVVSCVFTYILDWKSVYFLSCGIRVACLLPVVNYIDMWIGADMFS